MRKVGKSFGKCGQGTGQNIVAVKVSLGMALWRAFWVKCTTPQLNFKIPIRKIPIIFWGIRVERLCHALDTKKFLPIQKDKMVSGKWECSR